MAIDAPGIKPVGLHGNGRKAFFGDQALGDLCPIAIELMGAVRRFFQQGKARRADLTQQLVVLARIAGQWLRVRAQAFQQGGMVVFVFGLLRDHG